MDSRETTAVKKGPRNVCLRRSVVLLFSLIALLSLSFILGFAAFLAGNLSISKSIYVPSQCKIISSSVDLRSTKVCELGLFNYKAKNVFYPFERKKFRCRSDYYWASIFKVEYKDHLGQTRFALAEAPNEALPLHCRPNFGVAWLTKYKFKADNIFTKPLSTEKSRKILNNHFAPFRSTRILESSLADRERAWYWKWEVVAGVLTGFSTSLISISLIGILQQVTFHFCKIFAVRILPLASYAARLKQACLFVAYFSFMGWLAIQYGKKLGLPDIFRVH